jgi:hypothetical protein
MAWRADACGCVGQSASLLRLLGEIAEVRGAAEAAGPAGDLHDDDGGGDDGGQREMAVLTQLRTLLCLIGAIDEAPAIMLATQDAVVPVMIRILSDVSIGTLHLTCLPAVHTKSGGQTHVYGHVRTRPDLSTHPERDTYARTRACLDRRTRMRPLSLTRACVCAGGGVGGWQTFLTKCWSSRACTRTRARLRPPCGLCMITCTRRSSMGHSITSQVRTVSACRHTPRAPRACVCVYVCVYDCMYV